MLVSPCAILLLIATFAQSLFSPLTYASSYDINALARATALTLRHRQALLFSYTRHPAVDPTIVA